MGSLHAPTGAAAEVQAGRHGEHKVDLTGDSGVENALGEGSLRQVRRAARRGERVDFCAPQLRWLAFSRTPAHAAPPCLRVRTRRCPVKVV